VTAKVNKVLVDEAFTEWGVMRKGSEKVIYAEDETDARELLDIANGLGKEKYYIVTRRVYILPYEKVR